MPEEQRFDVRIYQQLTPEQRMKRVIALRDLEHGKSLEQISRELQVSVPELRAWTARVIQERPSRRTRA